MCRKTCLSLFSMQLFALFSSMLPCHEGTFQIWQSGGDYSASNTKAYSRSGGWCKAENRCTKTDLKKKKKRLQAVEELKRAVLNYLMNSLYYALSPHVLLVVQFLVFLTIFSGSNFLIIIIYGTIQLLVTVSLLNLLTIWFIVLW